MAADQLLATLEQTLRQTRQTRARLVARLAELEQEVTQVQTEIAEMDELTARTEETLYRFMSNVLGGLRESGGSASRRAAPVTPNPVATAASSSPPLNGPPVAASSVKERAVVTDVAQPIERLERDANAYQNTSAGSTVGVAKVAEGRFTERTISQATAALLREAGGPLHVNDIYQQLKEGGFSFSGHNPTISIAVSLNRNRRFRKVAPGTFDLENT